MAREKRTGLESEITTLKSVLIAVGFAASGLILMWLASAQGEDTTTAAFLGQVGGLLVATGGLGVAWELFGRRSFAHEVLAKAKLSADVVDSGVTRITDQYLHDVEWAELFSGAKKIDIVVAYARTWRNTHWSRLQEAARNRDAHIRVFLPDPADDDTMANLGHRFSKPPAEVAQLVREAVSEFRSLQTPGGATVEVAVRAGDALFSCYRFDHRAVLTLYSHSRSRQTSVPTLVVAGGDLFKFVRDEVDAIADQSTRAPGGTG